MQKIFPVLLLLICILLPALSFAEGPDDPEDTPIDGGLSLLLAAGAAYGMKKYRSRKTAMQKNTVFNNEQGSVT